MKRIFMFVMLQCFFSCREEYFVQQQKVLTDSPQFILTEGITVLGRQLKNPYSVENMRKALQNLSPRTRSGIKIEDIQTTHYYVRFHPQTQEELDLLLRDSVIIWYDIPLDYEIKEYGTYYHDPSIPDSLPTYQYAAIEVAKWVDISKIGIEHKILSNLFIPDEDKGEEGNEHVITRSGKKWTEVLTETLVEEALRLTENNDDIYESGLETRGRSKWRPSGRITYYDEILGRTIGLEGIKVKARRWFTTHTGIVDSEGYYSCDGRFRRPANYSFSLERYEVKVKGDGVRTHYDGPKRKGKWDYHFARSISQQEYFGATIFRAAYHYYYKNIGGLRRPPLNGFWRTKMRIKAIYKNDSDVNGNFKSARRFLGLGSAIKIWNPSRSTDEIYATTLHELAHAAHWRMIVKEPGTNRYRDYHNAEDKMVESWACGVQWYLTRMVYSGYRGRPQGSSNYTNVVIDLVDSNLDDWKNNGKTYSQGDKVEGYAMWQLETALQGCNTWNKWRDNIKRKYDNKTKRYVDELFAAW